MSLFMGIVGDERGWLVGKNRGAMVALISYGWRAEGLYWIGEMGERRGFSSLFLFSGRWLGVGAIE